MRLIHIDESAALGLDAGQAAAWRASVEAAVQGYCGDGVSYHCVPLEAVFNAGGDAVGTGGLAGAPAAGAGVQQVQQEQEQQQRRQRERLQALLSAVEDATGREDLVSHLRARLLLHTTAALGCGRLARGDCATSLAAHIVAAAAKGCGYSLPGDVRLMDARCVWVRVCGG